MKISIITVCYNSADTIEDTIKSVLSQDYPQLEYTIIDGGSTDATQALIDRYKDRIANVISEPDNGIYDAMNKGIRVCGGDVIAFLNADDGYADPAVISRMAAFIGDHSLDAAYGDIVYVNRLNAEAVVRYWKTGSYQKGAFRRGWVIPHPAFFCKKQIYDRYGGFNADFKIAADFELMLRFVERNRIKVGYLPEIIVNMRVGGKANRLAGILRGNREIIKSFTLNGMCISPAFFFVKPCLKLKQIIGRPTKVKQRVGV